MLSRLFSVVPGDTEEVGGVRCWGVLLPPTWGVPAEGGDTMLVAGDIGGGMVPDIMTAALLAGILFIICLFLFSGDNMLGVPGPLERAPGGMSLPICMELGGMLWGGKLPDPIV